MLNGQPAHVQMYLYISTHMTKSMLIQLTIFSFEPRACNFLLVCMNGTLFFLKHNNEKQILSIG